MKKLSIVFCLFVVGCGSDIGTQFGSTGEGPSVIIDHSSSSSSGTGGNEITSSSNSGGSDSTTSNGSGGNDSSSSFGSGGNDSTSSSSGNPNGDNCVRYQDRWSGVGFACNGSAAWLCIEKLEYIPDYIDPFGNPRTSCMQAPQNTTDYHDDGSFGYCCALGEINPNDF